MLKGAIHVLKGVWTNPADSPVSGLDWMVIVPGHQKE
jgi:hypothetical protein